MYCTRIVSDILKGNLVTLNWDSDSIRRYIDAILLGSASERINEHMRMFSSSKVTQHQLQANFYSILEPEVEAVVAFHNLITGSHPDHKKKLKKFANAYLLDVTELNMKSRCVFCWTGAHYCSYDY